MPALVLALGDWCCDYKIAAIAHMLVQRKGLWRPRIYDTEHHYNLIP